MARTTDSGTAGSVTDAAQDILAAFSDNPDENAKEEPRGGQDPDTDEEEPDQDDTDTAEEEDGDPDDTGEEDDDSDSEDDEESEEESEEEPEKKFKIKVDGEEIEVTLDELQKGYSRHADYSRKTQEVAEQRRAAEQEREQARQERAQYAQYLQVLQQQMQQQEPQVDWDKLYKEDPAEYVRKRAEYDDRQRKQQALTAEQQRIRQQQEQETAQQRQRTLAQERQRLTEAIPEFKDPEKSPQVAARIKKTGQALGFSESELSQVYDHRAVLALHKAALYDELMAKRENVKPTSKSKTRTAKPGTTKSPQEGRSRKARQSMARLKKTGSVHDAAASIEGLIED